MECTSLAALTPTRTCQCGKRSSICYVPRTLSAPLWTSAAPGTWTLRFRSNSQTTLLSLALKVVAGKLVWTVSQIADTDVRRDVIRKLCMRFSNANSPANADISLAIILARNQLCGEDCGRCMVALNNIQLPCGHFKDNVSCHLTQNLNSIQCNVVVNKTVPGCGHIVQVQCSQDVNKETYRCPNPCGTTLTCGHPCPGSCGRCNEGSPIVEHSKCDKVCGRHFGTCNHTCPKRCHDGSDCGLCMLRCEVSTMNSLFDPSS